MSTHSVLDYYDACFAAYGDTAQGAGWPNELDRQSRFNVILEIVDLIAPRGEVVLGDLGCGTGELLRHVRQRGLHRIGYVGVDALPGPLARARSKFPDADFHQLDLGSASADQVVLVECDVLVANGLFTVKRGMTEAAMWDFLTGVVRRFWPIARRGLVLNVMSPVVDWRRDDLFHVSYDRLARFLHELAGRRIGFRADYGLYEYMAYAIKPAREADG